MIDSFYWKYLDQQVFHVTSVQGYKGIVEQGGLMPNSGEMDFTFPHIESSYAKKNGYISLFDFYTCPDNKIEVMKDTWIRIVAKHKPTIVIVFDIDDLKNKIIPNSVLNDKFKDCKFMQVNYYVPRVEAWYPEPINVDRFQHILMFNWDHRKVTTYPES